MRSWKLIKESPNVIAADRFTVSILPPNLTTLTNNKMCSIKMAVKVLYSKNIQKCYMLSWGKKNLVGSGIREVIIIRQQRRNGFKKSAPFRFGGHPVVPSQCSLCCRMPFAHQFPFVSRFLVLMNQNKRIIPTRKRVYISKSTSKRHVNITYIWAK